MNSRASLPNDQGDLTPGRGLGHRLAEYNALIRELYNSSERYRAIVESSDDAILSKDLNGTITSWNSGAQRVFGYTESEIIGRSIKTLIPPDLHHEEDAILARLRQGLRIDHYVTRRMRKDGSTVDISLTISPIKNEYGEIVGASKVARDIGVQLSESTLRNRLSAIVGSSDDAIISKDLTGIITSWNKGAERMFGYTADEIVGNSIMRLIPKDLQKEEEEILSRLRKGQRIDHFKTVRLHKNGTRIDLSITVSPIRNDRDEIIGASKVARDIGGQLREISLSNRLSAIVESSDDAIISKNLDGTITSWNKGAERIFGYTADEMIDSSVLRLIPQDLHGQEHEILARLRNGERIDHFPTIRLRKDGTRVDISLTISPIKNDRGEIIGASKVARDITEEKLAIDKIRESEAKFNTIFMSSPVGAVLIDKSTFLLIDANPAFLQIMDVTLEEIVGKPAWDDHMVMDPVRWLELKHQLNTSDLLQQEELALRTKSGGYMNLLINATHVTISGEWCILMHVEDITERKMAIAALKEADSRKDEFIATLAHELRNPLAPLSNSLQLLDMAPDDPDIVRDARTMMGRQLKHMVRLINDLMDVSRVSRGVIELRKEHVSIQEVVLGSVEALKPFIDQQGHALKLELTDEKMFINGDSTRLIQIFSNLLNNATKYTEPGGRITISAERKNDKALITVEDTGVGIEPEKLHLVFEMFAQLEPAIARKQTGLGIGLSLVRQLVLLHGGTIIANSGGKGRGSTFIVEMPLVKNATRKKATARSKDGA